MNVFYLQAIITASVGGILFGYDMGVISGALPLLSETFQLTPSQEEWVVSLLYFGGGVGAATGGFICDWRGRKFAILITDVMFGLGAFMLCSAQNVNTVMVGRFVVGWAVAVSGIADVAYLHEISSVWEDGEGSREGERVRIDDDRPGQTANADDQIEEMEIKHDDMGAGGRGSVVSVNEACISVGFLLAYGVAFALGDHSQAWRIMFACGGLLAVLQFLGMLFMPESPVFLLGQGKIREAARASDRIRGIRRERMDDSPCEQHEQCQLEISQSAGIEMKESAPSPLDHQTETFSSEEQFNPPSRSSRVSECLIYLLISVKSIPSHGKRFRDEILVPYWKQFAIASFLAVSSQTCGHVSVLSFSEEIFAMLNSGTDGGDTSTGNEENEMLAIELTVGIGILKFLTTCLVILFIEKGGRRGWLLLGMSLILLSLLLLCLAFRNVGNISDDSMQQLDRSSKNDIGIAGVYGIAIGYAASYGPLNWLITSELFEPAIRGRALGFATVITYLAAGLVARTFLSLQEAIGLSATFALYWVATFLSMVLAWLGLPDTGGERTPQEIASELDSMWLWGGRRQPFLQGRFRSGNGPVARSSSWLNFGMYRYGSASESVDMGLSPDPSLDDDNDESAASGVTPSYPIDRSGLTPRRSSTKEII